MILSNLYHIHLEQGFIESKNTRKDFKSNFNEILDIYTVKKGDSLYKIAKNYLESKGLAPSAKDINNMVNKIAQLNNIKNPNLIFAGQSLNLEHVDSSYHKFPFPVDGYVSSKFGMRLDPFTKHMRFHYGLDIAAPKGSPIKAVADGEVIFSGEERGYGNIVILKHKNGLITKYAHNSKNLVKVGDYVKKGEVIGLVGMTGRATGPHVHFEVRYHGKAMNPLKYLKT